MRFPSSSPLLVLTLITARAALAQDAPPAASAPVATEAQQPKEGDDKKKEEPQGAAPNARLAPGGVVVGGGGFPLHVTATLDNSLGNGVLAATQYQQRPQWSTSLSLRPSAVLPSGDYFPRTILATSIDFSIPNWLPSAQSSGVYDRQLRVSDFGMAWVFPGLLSASELGIAFTPVISARVPLSIASRHQNMALSAAASAQAMWNSPDLWGHTFTVIVTPSLRGNAFTDVSATMPCDVPQIQNPQNPPSATPTDGVTTDHPTVIARPEEVTPGGECRLVGRHNMGSAAASGTVAWTFGNHNVATSLSWSVGLLRPLATRPELQSQYASDQSFVESSSGSIAYTYQVPVDFQLFLSAGVASSQPAYGLSGDLRFPFYDFRTPGNNFSAAFLDFTIGI